MPRKATFYRVAKPFDYFVQVGHRWTNTYIGRSQCSEQVLDPGFAEEGQVFHDLPGGLYTSGDTGAVCAELGHVAVLTRPKHIFEKNYGPPPDRLKLQRLIREGYLVECEPPSPKPDYNAWREFSQEMLS